MRAKTIAAFLAAAAIVGALAVPAGASAAHHRVRQSAEVSAEIQGRATNGFRFFFFSFHRGYVLWVTKRVSNSGEEDAGYFIRSHGNPTGLNRDVLDVRIGRLGRFRGRFVGTPAVIGRSGTLPASGTFTDAHHRVAAWAAHTPWRDRWPAFVTASLVRTDGDSLVLQDADGAGHPVVGIDQWEALAVTGGHEVQVFAEIEDGVDQVDEDLEEAGDTCEDARVVLTEARRSQAAAEEALARLRD